MFVLRRNPMLVISGGDDGGYFHIMCRRCERPTDNEYLGGDPSVPHFRAICPHCGKAGEWKLEGWKGLPLSLQ
jgi:hypothetical protein